MSLHTEFDKGSLIWVKSEIEETFGRARDALLNYAASGDDAALKHAQTHLHQVCGALTLVDLSGLARFCEEIELVTAQISRSEQGKEAIPVLLHGIEIASSYLDRLMAGMSNVPLLLQPIFAEIAAHRNGSVSGAELFFPQLQLDLPAGLPQKSLPVDEFPPFIRKQRSRFESALLHWLQGKENAAQAIAASLAEVATYQQLSVVRAFWWTAAALALGQASNRAQIDLDLRQLFLRLNLQLRRLSDGSGKVAERLFRDMLYVLAKMDCDSNLVRHLQKSFELGGLIPAAEALSAGVERGDLQLARALREDLRVVKDAWSRIAGGQRERLSQFATQLAALAKKTESLDAPALIRLWQGLTEAMQRYGASGPSDADALEFATGLLLADNALAVYPDLSADYTAQVEALLARLVNPATTVDLPQLDSVSREAQERLLMAQIAQEIRSNLQAVEEILDGYFRDSSNLAGLPGLVSPLRQVQGALLMLDRPRAVQILQECQKRVDGFMAGNAPEQAELEDLAEALSMLGFYIDDLEQGREKEETLQPALIKLCGLVEEMPAAPAIREILEAEPELAESGSEAPASQPEPVVVAESKPLPVSDAAIDAELLEVYLEEAVEVLAAIAAQLDVCKTDPYDREAATLIRRSFHTLKGSGRMVGLFNLGEVAWSVEQVFNKLLQVEKPVSHALVELVQQAHDAFSGWVDELQSRGTVEVEASALIAKAAALRDGLDSEPEPEPEGPAPETLTVSEDDGVSVAGTDNDDIVIGSVSVSSTLFSIFQEEAERHLMALKHGVDVLAGQGVAEPGFILAAHTLGGIASTTGFRRQGELAYALERALQQLGVDADRELELLTEAVNTLDIMLSGIFQRFEPGEASELVVKLIALRAEAPELVLDEDEGSTTFELDAILPPDAAAPQPVNPEPEAVDFLSLDEEVLTEPDFTDQHAILAPEVLPGEIDLLDEDAPLALAEPLVESLADEQDLAADEMPALLEEVSLSEAGFEPLPESALDVGTEPLSAPLLLETELDLALATPEAEPEIGIEPALNDAEFDLEAPVFESVLEQETPLETESAQVESLLVLDEMLPADVEPFEQVSEVQAVPEPDAIDREEMDAEQGEASDDISITAEPEELLVDAALELAGEAPELAAIELVETPPETIAAELETLSVVAEMTGEANSLAARKAEIDVSFVDDIDEQLLPVFIEEADELMPAVSTQLHQLAAGEDRDDALNRLKRTLHTLKGSARMSGAMRLGEATHQMETRLEGVTQPSEALLSLLDDDFDLLQMLFDEVSGRTVPTPQGGETTDVSLQAEAIAAPLPVQRALALAEPEGKATIRVKSDLVDELVNQAGEVSIARSRVEAEMLAFKGSLTDLTENVARLRGQLREIEIQAESQMLARAKELEEHDAQFDPLEFDRFTRLQELTRFLAESVNDVGNVQQTLLKNLDESNAALLAQSRMTRDLQQSLMRVRLVPFSSVSERLYRLARTTGKEVGKKVNLEIKGGSVEIDRGVLEKMASPFEHMLRNAIDHGLEDATARQAAGKSEFGEILIEARQEGNELVLTLKDDGRGLDLQRIRTKGIEKGLIAADQELSEHDLSMLIFEPGFSTAANVTQLSGRGIGMDVVKNEISNLGGHIDLVSQLGVGTTFTIRLPLTLAVTQVLLVRTGERMIAIPAALVEQVQELKHEALADLYAKREQEWMGKRYRFAYLPRLLGNLYCQPEQKRYSMVLLLRSGSDRIALHIDDLVKNTEVVVKPIGPQLARVPGVVGATVLGSGEIVLIMNPLFLLPLAEQIAAAVDPAQQTLAAAAQEKIEELQTSPVVMVVDDSLTVRKITSRLLGREGFQVVTAKDGVDALQQLQDVTPAVMLVDIEMPRMDGFELTRNVRAAPDTRDIPIIMITSRTADKHRNVAFDLGVNVFLGKPYQEDELLGHIRKFIDAE